MYMCLLMRCIQEACGMYLKCQNISPGLTRGMFLYCLKPHVSPGLYFHSYKIFSGRLFRRTLSGGQHSWGAYIFGFYGASLMNELRCIHTDTFRDYLKTWHYCRRILSCYFKNSYFIVIQMILEYPGLCKL